MLVLSRRKDESIVIGEGVVVTIVEISRGRVRLGISAPHNVSIRREEVHFRILEQQQSIPEDTASEDTMLESEPAIAGVE